MESKRDAPVGRRVRFPQHEEAKCTKAFILEGAIRAIAQTGTAEVSMRQIAHASGVSVGSMYEYFENRQALLASVYVHCAFLRLEFAENEWKRTGSVATALAAGFTMPSPIPVAARRTLHALCTSVFGRTWWHQIDQRIETITANKDPAKARLIRSVAESALLDSDTELSSDSLIQSLLRPQTESDPNAVRVRQ
jgi:AcrR family transcriptional regulator